MSKLAKVGIIVSLIIVFLLLLTPQGFAQVTINNMANNLPQTIRFVINMILYLVGFIAVLFLIIGGFQYITASGNPDQIEGAKKTIMYAVIGIIVVVISWSIVWFVVNSLNQTVNR
jgi:TRAP-type C4-dicarboxylate transport system permease small subunit